ncbi:hypothetical protein LINPERPRIM_LOCUS102 [Linum perenne]
MGRLRVNFPAKKKAIRKGDPNSTYMFALTMEVLYCLLNKAVVEGMFSFHTQYVLEE